MWLKIVMQVNHLSTGALSFGSFSLGDKENE
jgi:hypothetical protein